MGSTVFFNVVLLIDIANISMKIYNFVQLNDKPTHIALKNKKTQADTLIETNTFQPQTYFKR